MLVTRGWICHTCRRSILNCTTPKKQFQTAPLRWQIVQGIPPRLILQARKMALELQELEGKAAAMTEYTTQSVQLYKRIRELTSVVSNLKELEDSHTVSPFQSWLD